MACVDFLSQLNVVNDDPYASWIKFDEDSTVQHVQPFAYSKPTRHHEKKRSDDLLDIFEFLKQSREDDENKDDEKYILPKPVTNNKQKNDVPLLDFSMLSNLDPVALPHPVAVTKTSKPAVRSQPSSITQTAERKTANTAGLTLNIAGLHGSCSSKRISIEKEEHILSEVRTNLTENSRISELRGFVKTQFNIPRNAQLLIIYAHYVLSNDRDTLKSYGICNNACLFVLVCEESEKFKSFCQDSAYFDFFADSEFHGDIERAREYDSFERTQTSMVNLLNLTNPSFECKTVSDLDVLSYEMCTDCIKMPCGHGMPPDTLYLYAQSELTSKAATVVTCPRLHDHNNTNDAVDDDADSPFGNANDVNSVENRKCDKMWHYPVIRKVLLQSKQFKPVDLIKLELLHSWNLVKKYYLLSKCPCCKHTVYRHMADDRNRRYTTCPSCNVRFCFKCQNEWKHPTSTVYCGDEECSSFEREHYEILTECETKTIGSVSGVPSVRACPKCTQLIHHDQACKHMKCVRCKTDFCFVCLKQMVNGSWQCGSSSTVCPIAPRQRNVGEALKLPVKQKNKGKQKLAQVSEWGEWY